MKTRKNRISQRLQLFIVYGTFIFLLLASIFIYIYHFNRNNILHDETVKQTNIGESVREALDTELDNMATISLNLVYSNAIRLNFQSFAEYPVANAGAGKQGVEARKYAEKVYDIITAMIGSYQTVSQVNLYTTDGYCVSSGYEQRVLPVSLDSLPWISAVRELHGAKYISLPEKQPNLPAKGSNGSYHQFISMVRMYYNDTDTNTDIPGGIFEVVQDCGQIFSLADEMLKSNPGMNILIYNDRGEQVYPYYTESSVDYLSIADNAGLGDREARMINISGQNTVLLSRTYSSRYDWTVFTAEPASVVYASQASFNTTFFLFALIAFVMTAAICYVLSQKISLPLRELSYTVKNMTMDRVLNDSEEIPQMPSTNVSEIDDLCRSFQDMFNKLGSSSRDLLLAKSEEIRADLQATQSLINPHFLYNSLTSISILAENGEDQTVVMILNALCDYLRYIADSRTVFVPLKTEIESTEKYISCMQIRFGDSFVYSSDIGRLTADIEVPKLIVQPLVENAFKYAFNEAPPWKLSIKSYLDGDNWRIRVEDSGKGLSDEKRFELLQELYHMNHAEELKQMRIGGMGLKNVWVRLSLLYEDNAFIDIDNSTAGKNAFIIGGPVKHSRENKNYVL
jgi:two-component system sensor histidine kinase YesM